MKINNYLKTDLKFSFKIRTLTCPEIGTSFLQPNQG